MLEFHNNGGQSFIEKEISYQIFIYIFSVSLISLILIYNDQN